MKKIVNVMIVLVLVVGLFTGCGAKQQSVNDDVKSGSSTTNTQTKATNQSTDELLEQIDNLQAEIESLKNELTVVKQERDDLKSASQTGNSEATTKNKREKQEKQSEVIVEVIDKINIPRDTDKWRFSERVEFELQVINHTDKEIKGIQGTLEIKDMFNVNIMTIGCDITGQKIKPHDTIIQSGLGFEINQYLDDQLQVYLTDFEDLIFEYTATQIVFADGTSKTL